MNKCNLIFVKLCTLKRAILLVDSNKQNKTKTKHGRVLAGLFYSKFQKDFPLQPCGDYLALHSFCRMQCMHSKKFDTQIQLKTY